MSDKRPNVIEYHREEQAHGICILFCGTIGKQRNVNPDQTALIWDHDACHGGFLNILADSKADDFCCDWCFKGSVGT